MMPWRRSAWPALRQASPSQGEVVEPHTWACDAGADVGVVVDSNGACAEGACHVDGEGSARMAVGNSGLPSGMPCRAATVVASSWSVDHQQRPSYFHYEPTYQEAYVDSNVEHLGGSGEVPCTQDVEDAC